MRPRSPRIALLVVGLLGGGLLAGPLLPSLGRAETAAVSAPTFTVAGAFCAPRTGSPAAAAAGFGVAALGIALLARRRGASRAD